MHRAKDSVIITKRALAAMVEGADTAYIHADRLLITGPEKNRLLRGYNDVRLLKGTMSGKADSIISFEKTGLTKLIHFPILWNDKSQITGDTIFLQSNLKTEKLDSLRVHYNAFIVSNDSLDDYNQVKGKVLTGLFENNQLHRVFINKNIENLFYSRNSENALIGINKGTSGSLELVFEEKKITEITLFDQSEDETYPPEDLPKNARRLRGFTWRGDERILKKEDLFDDEDPVPVKAIKGLKRPKADQPFFDPDQKNARQSVLKTKDLQNKEENQPKKRTP